VTIEVTLAIEPAEIGGKTTAIVATHPVELGGTLVSWRPEMNGEPALATFDFPTENARAQFVPGALKIHGISLATVNEQRSAPTQGGEISHEQERR
jgi:hypothetical protein